VGALGDGVAGLDGAKEERRGEGEGEILAKSHVPFSLPQKPKHNAKQLTPEREAGNHAKINR
jgi:hypothetical protein